MTINYTIDQDNRTVYVEVGGEVTVEKLIETEKIIIADPQHQEGFNTYADFSRAKPSHTVDIEKIKMSKEFVESIQDIRGKCKWALYAPDDYTYAFCHMFAILSKELQVDTEVFREPSKALEWLGVDKGT